MKEPEYLAIELEGLAAILNALVLQYEPNTSRLSEEENETALYAAQQQLRRIAEDLREIEKARLEEKAKENLPFDELPADFRARARAMVDALSPEGKDALLVSELALTLQKIE